MKRWKKALVLLAVLLFAGMAVASPAAAIQPMAGEYDDNGNFVLPKGKTVDDDVFIAGNQVVVEGDVNGDLMVFGQKVTINGNVTGDLFAAAKEIYVHGQIRDDARLAAETIIIQGKVERNLTSASRNLIIDKDGVVGRNALTAAESVDIFGALKGNLQGAMGALNVQGTLGGAGMVKAERITVGPAGVIQGGLYYTSSREVEIAPGGKILGPTERQEPVYDREKARQEAERNLYWYKMTSGLLAFLGGLLLWFLWRTFFPASLARWTETMETRTGMSFLLGFALLLAVPLAAVLAALTVIGLPLGVIGVLAYGVILYLSKLVAAQAIGLQIFRRTGWLGEKWAFPAGLFLVVLLSLLPYVGFFVKVAIYFVGLGSAAFALARAAQPNQPIA